VKARAPSYTRTAARCSLVEKGIDRVPKVCMVCVESAEDPTTLLQRGKVEPCTAFMLHSATKGATTAGFSTSTAAGHITRDTLSNAS
jgi:hypothetical protein